MVEDTTDNTNLGEIGTRLRMERIRLGYNQADFAALADAHANSQTRYETGIAAPKLEYLMKLKSHGVDISFVLTGRSLDGSSFALEQELLDQFRSMRKDDKDALLRVAKALAAYDIETPEQFLDSIEVDIAKGKLSIFKPGDPRRLKLYEIVNNPTLHPEIKERAERFVRDIDED